MKYPFNSLLLIDFSSTHNNIYFFPFSIYHHFVEVYKDKIEGSVTNPEKYGQEVRKAIRLSRLRVLRGKNRQKILSERSKNKKFNYFHYP